MRSNMFVRIFPVLVLAVLLCASIVPNRLLADDKDSNSTPAKSAPAKPDSPGPLTERERWMLDRMEQLEKRVAELEAKGKSIRCASCGNGSTTTSSCQRDECCPGCGKCRQSDGSGGLDEIARAGHLPGKPKKAEPFAFADFTWLNGNARTKELAMDTKFFTPEIRADVDYVYDFNHPKDDTIGGSSEVFRSNEVQLTQLGVGGDFHYDNVRARLMTQFGLYSETTPRNDASPSRGQWNLADAYRYISEAYGGYHFNALHGINVDAGIFMSYVGLFSYYQFDNWAYQPSYVSSNTPWFFNGVRVQIFPTEHLKIEPWFTNGWQSYGRFNNRPGVGAQILWRPNGWLSVLGNQYALGEDALNTPGRVRYHTDDSIQIKYYDNQSGSWIRRRSRSPATWDANTAAASAAPGIPRKGPNRAFSATCFTTGCGSTTTSTV